MVRLAKALPREAIEYGWKQARLFGRLRLRYITDCIPQFHRNGARSLLVKTAPQRQLSELFLHEKDWKLSPLPLIYPTQNLEKKEKRKKEWNHVKHHRT